MKKFIKSLIPPIFLVFLKKLRINKYGWKGNYPNWQKAEEASSGYDSDEIIQKVRSSLLKVKNGEAVYERDSIIFDEIQYSWPILSGLMLASTKFKGNLNVLDFGGSLGSSFYQNKKFLDRIEGVSWSIVEQDKFVQIGKREFTSERLNFYYSIEECIEKNRPNVLLLSSVLQYLEKPYMMLDKILQNDFEYVLVDLTPFTNSFKDRVKLQIVPSYLYNASYPCWIFNENSFIHYFIKNNYKVLEKFKSLEVDSDEFFYKGMILEKDYNS